MKNLLYRIFFYIIFCLIQFFFGKYINNIFGIFPNFILIAVMYLGISKSTVCAEVTGFLFGLTWDVFSCNIFCVRTIMFTIVGYLSGKIYVNFDKERVSSQFVITLIAGVVYWFGLGTVYFILLGEWSYLYSFFGLTGIFKIIVTALVAPGVFWILDHTRGDA